MGNYFFVRYGASVGPWGPKHRHSVGTELGFSDTENETFCYSFVLINWNLSNEILNSKLAHRVYCR